MAKGKGKAEEFKSEAEVRYHQKCDKIEERFKRREINKEKAIEEIDKLKKELRIEQTEECFKAIDEKDLTILPLIAKNPLTLKTKIERKIIWKEKSITAEMTPLMYLLYTAGTKNELAEKRVRALLYPICDKQTIMQSELDSIRTIQVLSYCEKSGLSAFELAHYVKDKIGVYEILFSALPKKERTLVCHGLAYGGSAFKDGKQQETSTNFFLKAIANAGSKIEIEQIVTMFKRLEIDLKNPATNSNFKPLHYFALNYNEYNSEETRNITTLIELTMISLVTVGGIYPERSSISILPDNIQQELRERHREASKSCGCFAFAR